jgi:hypothetical protein
VSTGNPLSTASVAETVAGTVAEAVNDSGASEEPEKVSVAVAEQEVVKPTAEEGEKDPKPMGNEETAAQPVEGESIAAEKEEDTNPTVEEDVPIEEEKQGTENPTDKGDTLVEETQVGDNIQTEPIRTSEVAAEEREKESTEYRDPWSDEESDFSWNSDEDQEDDETIELLQKELDRVFSHMDWAQYPEAQAALNELKKQKIVVASRGKRRASIAILDMVKKSTSDDNVPANNPNGTRPAVSERFKLSEEDRILAESIAEACANSVPSKPSGKETKPEPAENVVVAFVSSEAEAPETLPPEVANLFKPVTPPHLSADSNPPVTETETDSGSNVEPSSATVASLTEREVSPEPAPREEPRDEVKEITGRQMQLLGRKPQS